MMTDPIADLLIRIKNARLAKHSQLVVPYSRLKEELVRVLTKIGCLGSFTVKGRELVIKEPRLLAAKRLSRPGGRLYAGAADLLRYRRGRGETILSTSQGLMTAREAFKKKLGGELLCQVISLN
jgi:small subunit ribosomal protein S8